jgi:hypothetical protein
MNKSKFSTSFTAGALLYNEFMGVLPFLKQTEFEKLLDQEKAENKLLKIRTESARTRVNTEIKKRARTVPSEFWLTFAGQSEQQQRIALYYLILKAYPLALDFHFEVVLKRWKSMQYTLDKYDLQMRLDEISSNEEDVGSWTDSTKNKTLTQFIRILREAGLMKENLIVKPEIHDNSFWHFFIQHGDVWFMDVCLLTKSEREALQ